MEYSFWAKHLTLLVNCITWKSFKKATKPQPKKKPTQNPNIAASKQTNKHNPQPYFFPLINVEWKTKCCSLWICQVCTVFSWAFICELCVFLLKYNFINLFTDVWYFLTLWKTLHVLRNLGMPSWPNSGHCFSCPLPKT